LVAPDSPLRTGSRLAIDAAWRADHLVRIADCGPRHGVVIDGMAFSDVELPAERLMANRTYLLNTAFPTSDPDLLEAKLSEPGNDFVEVAEAAYKIPVPWLLCFQPEDIRPVRIPVEEGEDFESGDAAAGGVEVGLPCTSVKRALKNMEQALPVFESIAGDAKLGKMFWQVAMSHLQGLPLPHLTMNPIEVMFMDDPIPYAQLIRAAIGGGKTAIEGLIDLSCYEKGVLPYPPDVLYAVTGRDHNEARMQNSVALDIGYANFWHDSAGTEGAQRPGIPLAINSPAAAPNLRTLLEEVETLARAKAKSASAHLSFAPRMASQSEQLKMLLSAGTDAECDALVKDMSLRRILDGSMHTKLNMLCQSYGFSWVGYVFRSDESVKRRFKGDYGVYNDWVSLPVEKPVI